MNLKRHHKIAVAFIVVFIAAWAIWTFVMLPLSDAPALPESPVKTP